MKKYIKIAALSCFALFSMSSCNDYLGRLGTRRLAAFLR